MFCPNPFERLEIKVDGSAYCCCDGWLPKPLGNVLDTDLLELWYGEVAREIRSSILDESFRHCRACPYLPGPGGPITTLPRAIDSSRIHVLKLDYDRTCQLQCPSCRTTHSRNFASDARASQIHKRVIESGVLNLVDRLYVTGSGDPFASPLYWNFLKNLPEYPSNPRLDIFLHTNGLLCDEQHWNELGPRNQARVAEIGISVDAGTPETYQINRGGSWDRLWRNVDFINRLQESGRKIMLGMFFTVQQNNFRELIPFVRLAVAHRAFWICVTALRNWGTFSNDDYLERAVHHPKHRNYAEFKQIVSYPELTGDSRVILEQFNPDHTDGSPNWAKNAR
jgi:sulfatase maturation enzyme AslB (radical SAM superfamily)